MTPKRMADIKSSLIFGTECWRELQVLIGAAQEKDNEVTHIGHKTGVILQSVRQCFDYCAADIADDFISTYNGNIYYPFHPDSLGKGRPFHALSTTSPQIYAELMRVADSIINRKIVENTMALYSDVRAINDLVNESKHNAVTVIGEIQNSQTRVKFPNGSVITMTSMVEIGPDGVADVANAKAPDPSSWSTTPGVSIKPVKNFVLPNTYGLSRRDVGGFCMVAIAGARYILSDIYAAAYGTPNNIFHA